MACVGVRNGNTNTEAQLQCITCLSIKLIMLFFIKMRLILEMGREKISTSDNILDLLFAQQLLASLEQELNVQDKSRSQVRGRLKALTHTFQIL